MSWSVQSQIEYIQAHIDQTDDSDHVWHDVIESLQWLLRLLTERVENGFSELCPSDAIQNIVNVIVDTSDTAKLYHYDPTYHGFVETTAHSLYNSGMEITKRALPPSGK